MKDFNFDMEIDSILAEFTGTEKSASKTGKITASQDYTESGRREMEQSSAWQSPFENESDSYYEDEAYRIQENGHKRGGFGFDSDREYVINDIEETEHVRSAKGVSSDRSRETVPREESIPEAALDEENLSPIRTRRDGHKMQERLPERKEQNRKDKVPEAPARKPWNGKRTVELRATAERTAKKSISKLRYVVMTFTGLVFGALSVLLLFWMLSNVHPDSAMASSQITGKKRANIVNRLDAYANNIKGELLSELTFIRKHYVIPDSDLVAPEAPAYNYGTTTDPDEVLAIIEEARSYGLLDNQDVVFNKNVDFYYDSDIQYYCDETLLVICWKELIENRICSCVEVKMADGSQLRRKLADDTYGSSTYVYATELAAQCNAVVSMNADYYAFRDLGITVFNHKLYRFDESNYNGQFCKYNAIDSLLIDGKGDFHIFHKGDVCTRAEMEQYVKDNDIMFSIAFGPLLVENGEQVWCDWYPVGEVDKEYSRASISQVDSLHYLYMTVSFADRPDEYHPRCTINEFSAILAGKGVKTGYCLDGGQTGEVVFRGVPYNHIDFGTERAVSDIIYFATAIPASER